MAASSGQNGKRKTSNGQKKTTTSSTRSGSNPSKRSTGRSTSSRGTRSGKPVEPDNSIMDEIVLILVVLIGLVLIFKDQITEIVNNVFESISGDAGEIIH